jgi:hypothetical protein
MGHADLVGVWKAECHSYIDSITGGIFSPNIQFTIYIAARFLEPGKVHSVKITSVESFGQGNDYYPETLLP